MAGHSQFANIKHRKDAQDAKRSKKFTKLRREIIVAARSGTPDLDKNPKLKAVVQRARRDGLSKDKIEAAIKSASGLSPDDDYEEVFYEGYAPGGVAVVVTALTDSRNRTASDVRHIFGKFGGALGESGGVLFLFDRVGKIVYPNLENFDNFFEYAVDAGATDVVQGDEGWCVYCEKTSFADILERLTSKFGDAHSSSLIWKPKTKIRIEDEKLEALSKMLDALEENDDVQDVATNLE